MTYDGERGNWQGQRFSESCEDFIKKLNFEEQKTRTAGKDMVAMPQEDGVFLKPYFSPSGLTAFEFTVKGDISEQEIDNFAQKIKGGIKGCILIRNIKIRDVLIEYGKERNVFCWDNRTVDFLSTKILLSNFWSKYGMPIEKKYSNEITYVRCVERNIVNDVFQVRLVILAQDPLAELGVDEIKKTLEDVKTDLKNSGIAPCQIKLIILSRSLPRKDLYNQIDSVLKKASTSEMAFTTVKNPIVDFYTSPFYFKLMLSDSTDILL